MVIFYDIQRNFALRYFLKIFFKQLFVFLFKTGVNQDWLDLVLNKSSSSVASKYNGILIDKLLSIIHISSQPCE